MRIIRNLAFVIVTAAAGLGLALPAASAAPITAVSVSANPTSFSGMVGTALANPVKITVTQDAFLTKLALTPTVVATGLPDGVTLGSNGVISGTPTKAGNGTATVTATVVESSVKFIFPLDGSGDGPSLPGCSYSINAPKTITLANGDSPTPDTITNVAIDPTSGQITYTGTDSSGGPDSTTVVTSGIVTSLNALNVLVANSESNPGKISVDKTCTGSVQVPWAIGQVTTPPTPPAPPASNNVPSGGVQTGGGTLPAGNPTGQVVGIVILLATGLFVAVGYTLRRIHQN